ncbi:MAG: acetyl-CoA hydrolase/transferase C-terminal domain-containing protein, partial [Woeseiaceae bacterium]|nr:acetyl-CoA hydrolase/transferase C-terminal domain-containing protein [Woeseiaceae bacterium]
TVPRHYRDIVVSEYGIADLRGISDRRVIEAMLSIADSSFQEELIDAATEAGKLPAEFSLPQETQRNTPEAINAVLRADGIREHFPEYPLGSDFTPVEQRLVRALRFLEQQKPDWHSRLRLLLRALPASVSGLDEELDRMALDQPATLRERVNARLIAYALSRCDP